MSCRLATALLTLFASCAVLAPPLAHGQQLAPEAAADTAAQRDTDRAQIERLKAEAKALRAEAEATYLATEPLCFERFLVNRCIDEAKERRIETTQRARALESEARKLERAGRQRAAAEVRGPAAAPTTPSDPSPDPQAGDPTSIPAPAPDGAIAPSPEAERVRAGREAAARRAEADAARARSAEDAERAATRAKTEAEAAKRAEQAARDRDRYDERIRRYEEEQAGAKK